MARMIDGDKLVENLRLIATCWSISPFVSKEKHNGAVDMLREVEREVKEAPTLTPQNEPLTIEQLREMDGEPVYAPETNCWVLITKNQFVPLFTWPDGEQCSAHDWYEQVGPVYRRPPERQEDT